MFLLPLESADPLALLAAVARDPVAMLLDSAAPDEERGRYSFLAVEPFALLTADESGTRLDGERLEQDPFTALQALLARYSLPSQPGAPFQGGAVGYLSYEAGRFLDRFPPPQPDAAPLPDLVAGLFDLMIVFDWRAGTCWIASSGLPAPEGPERAARARDRAEALRRRLAAAPPLPPLDWSVTGSWQADKLRAVVEADVQRVIDYIAAGDIFQANLTQRRRARLPDGLDALMLYRRLRSLSPAPFAAFLRAPGATVLSASPERFLSLSAAGEVETRPIKGTRRRDPDPAQDRALAAELLASEKDRAENLMIVDLMRNDLGRVCQTGSIAVPALNGLESFASVHHLVSAVTGRMKPGLGAVDLLRACFPGGSITGAPKIRAMEIIAELEPHRRGPCFGSVFHIGFDGAMDSSIAIRTLTLSGETLTAEAGGGIVSDSDPAAEYDEALLKMRPLLRALAGPEAAVA